MRWREKIRLMAYISLDVIAIGIAIVLTTMEFNSYVPTSVALNCLEEIGLTGIISIVYICLFSVMNIYKNTLESEGRLNRRLIVKMALAHLVGIMIIKGVLYLLNVGLVGYFILLLAVNIFFIQILERKALKYIEFGKNEVAQTTINIIMVGVSELGKQYLGEIDRYGYLNLHIIGYVSMDESERYENIKHLGALDDLENIVLQNVVDEIAVVRPLSDDTRLIEKLNMCQAMGITVTMVLKLHYMTNVKIDIAMVGEIPVLKFHMVSLNEGQLFIKRLLDVGGAIAGMMIFGLIYIIAAPLIKLESAGPVIFKQDRIGKNGRVFKLWKFRSMVDGADNLKESLQSKNEMNGQMFKMKNDPRVTRIGAFLRKTSMDEVPQFLNVLRGDMSLVGTRPPTVNEVRAYENHHRCRIAITPGITGLWQISGRSEIKNFEEIVRYDIEYISNWSVWLDIKILLKTIIVVLAERGSS